MSEQTYVFRDGPYDDRLMKTNVILPRLFFNHLITDGTEMTDWARQPWSSTRETAGSEGPLP